MAQKNKSYKRGKRFLKGAPQLTFTKRNGKKFTKTFKTKKSLGRAVAGWVKNGGKKPKYKTYSAKKR